MASIDEIIVYRKAIELGESVWGLTKGWDRFSRQTIGRQIVTAADSIAANISEGYGRFHFAENRQFCFYARGSLFEVRTWIRKARSRDLMTQDDFEKLDASLDELGRCLNGYIKSIGSRSQ